MDQFYVCFPYLVCSTTLWVGQVDKKATQQDLTNLFEEFGQIESINVSKAALKAFSFSLIKVSHYITFNGSCPCSCRTFSIPCCVDLLRFTTSDTNGLFADDPPQGLCLHLHGPQTGCIPGSSETQHRLFQNKLQNHQGLYGFFFSIVFFIKFSLTMVFI